jgi:hypothetical protein
MGKWLNLTICSNNRMVQLPKFRGGSIRKRPPVFGLFMPFSPDSAVKRGFIPLHMNEVLRQASFVVPRAF